MDTTNATTSLPALPFDGTENDKPMKLRRGDWWRTLRLMVDGKACRPDVISSVFPGVKLSEMADRWLVRQAPARPGMKWFPCDGYVITNRGRATFAAYKASDFEPHYQPACFKR